MTVDQYTFSLEEIARASGKYEQYVFKNVVYARLQSSELSQEVQDIFNKATSIEDGYSYEEQPPISSELNSALKHLSIADSVGPYDSYDTYTEYQSMNVQYDGIWYEMDFEIYV